MTFQKPLLLFYPPPSFFCAFLPLPNETPHFPISMIRSLVPRYFPFYYSPIPLPQQLPHFTFLVSACNLDYRLTYTDLELGTPDKREHVMFVFLGLGYQTFS